MFKACGILSCVSESAVLDVSNDPIAFITAIKHSNFIELIDCQDEGTENFQNVGKYVPKDTKYKKGKFVSVHAMKICKRVEVSLQSFFMSVPDGGK
jgi:hypothetical protein